MDKELCFKIENENLYAEQVLVDYMDIPIFFLCKSEIQYYIVLCTDIENLNYVVTKLSLADVYHLLHEEIPMRDVILKQSEYWDIESGEEIESDVVTKHKISELDRSVLPEKGAYFKALTKQIKAFIENFDKNFIDCELEYSNYFNIEIDRDLLVHMQQICEEHMEITLNNQENVQQLGESSSELYGSNDIVMVAMAA